LPNPLATKLSFLNPFGIEFGGWISNLDGDGGQTLIVWMLIGFIIILFFNSIKREEDFKRNNGTALFTAIIFTYSIFSMYQASEFLYFHF
ncbi:MBOAT family protein, partial [Campylobacterota bacterium]